MMGLQPNPMQIFSEGAGSVVLAWAKSWALSESDLPTWINPDIHHNIIGTGLSWLIAAAGDYPGGRANVPLLLEDLQPKITHRKQCSPWLPHHMAVWGFRLGRTVRLKSALFYPQLKGNSP